MADGKRVIFAGYVCEVVDRCTCAGGGEWPHEPHCGLEPLHLATDLPHLVPSWRFVVPETSEGAPGIRVISCTPPPVEGVAADNLQQELDRLEGTNDPVERFRTPGYDGVEGTEWPRLAGTYDPDLQEARIHQVLGEDELHD
jgi:hypothetical protein